MTFSSRLTPVIVSCLLIWAMGGCSRLKPSEVEEVRESTEIEKADLSSEALAWADSVVAEMSLDEQLAQLLMPSLYSSADPATLQRLDDYASRIRVGGILLLKGEASAAALMADSLEAVRRRLPLAVGTFLAVDAETGLGMRFSDAPRFPWNRDVDPAAGDEVFFDYGAEVGREARITGINMILGPVVDIDRLENARAGVMKRRSLGSDQLRVAELSLAYARGLESRGVACVVKHFPGHGPTASDSHRSLPAISTPRDELYAIDLLPFRNMIQNGVSAVMVGHIWAQALDSVKRPASFSPIVIQQLLREEMGFDGLVLVDAMEMEGARGYSGADAIIAGADMIIAPPDTRLELDRLREAVAAGWLSRERVSDSCRRILFYKYLYGVNSPQTEVDANPASRDEIKERLHEEAPRIISNLTAD